MESASERKINYKNINSYTKTKDCPASKASTEIMLNRVCKGNSVEFPFLKN